MGEERGKLQGPNWVSPEQQVIIFLVGIGLEERGAKSMRTLIVLGLPCAHPSHPFAALSLRKSQDNIVP